MANVAIEFFVEPGHPKIIDVESEVESRFGMIVSGTTDVDRHEEEFSKDPNINVTELCGTVGSTALRLVSSADSDY